MRDYEFWARRRPLRSRRDVSDHEREGPSSAASELFQSVFASAIPAASFQFPDCAA